MRCMFCNKTVFGESGMTIQNQGVAHQHFFQAHEALRRTFQSLDVSALSNDELTQLKDIVLAEENARQREHIDDGDIELF